MVGQAGLNGKGRDGLKLKGWQGHVTLFGLAGASNMCAAAITNPVNVVKVRMQLDGALTSSQVTPTPFLMTFLLSVDDNGGVLCKVMAPSHVPV